MKDLSKWKEGIGYRIYMAILFLILIAAIYLMVIKAIYLFDLWTK